MLWLLFVISKQKSNFNVRFKLESVTTYHLKFVVKILWILHFFYNKKMP